MQRHSASCTKLKEREMEKPPLPHIVKEESKSDLDITTPPKTQRDRSSRKSNKRKAPVRKTSRMRSNKRKHLVESGILVCDDDCINLEILCEMISN